MPDITFNEIHEVVDTLEKDMEENKESIEASVILLGTDNFCGIVAKGNLNTILSMMAQFLCENFRGSTIEALSDLNKRTIHMARENGLVDKKVTKALDELFANGENPKFMFEDNSNN